MLPGLLVSSSLFRFELELEKPRYDIIFEVSNNNFTESTSDQLHLQLHPIEIPLSGRLFRHIDKANQGEVNEKREEESVQGMRASKFTLKYQDM